MGQWFNEYPTLIWWLLGISVVTFIGTIIAVPLLVVRLPADYFAAPKRPAPGNQGPKGAHPIWRLTALILKNLLGIILLLGGLAMLVLPGQGVITILIGITLLNFPGKYPLERWLVSRRPVFKAINWIRGKAGHDPLLLPTSKQNPPSGNPQNPPP